MSEEQIRSEELEDTAQETAEEAPVEETVVAEVVECAPDPEPEPEPEPEVEAEPEQEIAPEPEPELAPEPAPRQLSQTMWIALCCAALVLGLLIGKFALGGSSAAAGDFAGKTSITEAELDLPIATLTYAGTSEAITAREIILANGSLETAMDEEGNYFLPSADAVLSTARNRIIDREAESRGVAATDEEVAAFAEENLGSSDYTSIAQTYGMDEQSVIEVLHSSATMQKLRAEVVGTTTAVMPEPPAELAEDADASAPTADYAAYVISLAGDEWDAAKGDWAAPTGPFATALANYEITADGATYEAAQTAYYVAYQLYSEQVSASSQAWSEFVNSLLANAQIEIHTLVA